MSCSVPRMAMKMLLIEKPRNNVFFWVLDLPHYF